MQNISTFTTGSKEVKLLRLRIYEFENDLQGENLLNENVFVRIEQKGWVTTDLIAYNICTEKPLLVCFEWLDEDTSVPFIAIGGFGTDTYYRMVSNSPWQKTNDLNWTIKGTFAVVIN